MTEIDYLKCKLEDKEKAFDKLHKRHMELLKQQGELEGENEQLKKEMNRLYNYFEDWYRDMTSANDFSEIWDNVKEDERWCDVE